MSLSGAPSWWLSDAWSPWRDGDGVGTAWTQRGAREPGPSLSQPAVHTPDKRANSGPTCLPRPPHASWTPCGQKGPSHQTPAALLVGPSGVLCTTWGGRGREGYPPPMLCDEAVWAGWPPRQRARLTRADGRTADTHQQLGVLVHRVLLPRRQVKGREAHAPADAVAGVRVEEQRHPPDTCAHSGAVASGAAPHGRVGRPRTLAPGVRRPPPRGHDLWTRPPPPGPVLPGPRRGAAPADTGRPSAPTQVAVPEVGARLRVDLRVGVEVAHALDVHHDQLVAGTLEREVAEGLRGDRRGPGCGRWPAAPRGARTHGPPSLQGVL